ncbi:MAG: hypothetical protein J6S58_01090 [Lentisphaeria bacterium]|nr:hypothetical protein [Lentisphaeria bacterium]
MRTALYFLCFALLLPCEMLIWGSALDRSLAGTVLAQRIGLSLLMEIPGIFLILPGIAVLFCILRGSFTLQKGSHADDGLLYGSIVTLTALLFLYFRMPCSFALILPLMCLGCAGAWYSSPVSFRKKSFLLPKNTMRKAVFSEYFRAFHLLLGIQCAGCILFQNGYSLWLSYPLTSVFVLLPFLGIIQRTPEQLRSYIGSAFGALILCTVIYGGGLFFLEGLMISDLRIFLAVLFVVLQCMLFMRQWLKGFKNLSVLLLLPAAGLSLLLLPDICSLLLIPLTAFLLYLLIDNAKMILRFLLSLLHSRSFHIRLLSEDKYKAIAWGGSAVLTACLLGPAKFRDILICIGVLAASALLRTFFLNNRREDHIILRNFPYIAEVIFLGGTLLILSGSLPELLGMLCAFACGATLLQAVWHTGELGRHTNHRQGVLSRIFLASAWSLCTVLMIVLFCLQFPAGLYLGLFLILSGIIRVWDSSYHRKEEERRVTAGWVLVVLGQFISVTTPGVLLPVPEWYNRGLCCGLLAMVAALCTFHIQDSRKLKKETLS